MRHQGPSVEAMRQCTTEGVFSGLKCLRILVFKLSSVRVNANSKRGKLHFRLVQNRVTFRHPGSRLTKASRSASHQKQEQLKI